MPKPSYEELERGFKELLDGIVTPREIVHFTGLSEERAAEILALRARLCDGAIRNRGAGDRAKPSTKP